MTKRTDGAASLRKALRMIDIVARDAGPVKATELARRADMTRPTAYRIAAVLAEEEFLRSTAEGYMLGPHLLEIAHAVWDRFDIRAAGSEPLAALAERTGATARLWTIDGDRLICIDRMGADDGAGAGIGASVSAGRSAPGSAILAFSEAATAERSAGLDLVRARYYALDEAEQDRSRYTLAAPVFDPRGRPVAAVSLSEPAHLAGQHRFFDWGADVIEAARTTSRAAGGYPFALGGTTRTPAPFDTARARHVYAAQALIGDGPIVHDGSLWWIDLLGPSLSRADPKTGHVDTVTLPDVPGALLRLEGDLVVVLNSGAHRIDVRTLDLKRLWPLAPGLGFRVNDGGVDPDGRIWLGLMDVRLATGNSRVVRLDASGGIDRELPGWSLPNGIDWTPDGRRMAVVDSAAKGVVLYDWSVAGSGMGLGTPRRIDLELGADERPAGLSCAANGTFWTCIWDGWRVMNFDCDGAILSEHPLPVPRPAACLATPDGVWVTTARARLLPTALRAAPQSGDVFLLQP